MPEPGTLLWTIAQGGALLVILFSFLWEQWKERPAARAERDAYRDAIKKCTDDFLIAIIKLQEGHNNQLLMILNSGKERHDAVLGKMEALVTAQLAAFTTGQEKQREWIITEFRLQQSGMKELSGAVHALTKEMHEQRINKPIRGGKRDEPAS